MSLLKTIFGQIDQENKVNKLEKRIEVLETALLEVTFNFKNLVAISLRLGEEVDNLAKHIKSIEKKDMIANQMKKNDDVYN